MRPPSFAVIEYPTATFWCAPDLPQSLPRRFAVNPGDLIRTAAGRPVKLSHDSIVCEADWPADDRRIRVAVKQFRPRSFWKTLAAIFRPAKATENCGKAQLLLAHGVATPRPLLACRPRGWWNLGTSFLATEWIRDAENVHLFAWRIASLPLAARLRVVARCAAVLGQLLGGMHAARITHRDLKAANLLILDDGSEATAYLVDLDGLQPCKSPIKLEQMASDLARLAAGLHAHAWVGPTICRRFLRAYLRQFLDHGDDWKRLWREVARQTAKYVARKRKLGQRVL